MAASPFEEQLGQFFYNFEQKCFSKLDRHFMSRTLRVYNHYLGEDQSTLQTLNSFIQCCTEGNWTKATSLFPGAKDEYERYNKTNGYKNQPLISTTDRKEHVNLPTPSKDEDLERRSKEASYRLMHNNPNLTDLSDPNRPGKLAERFSELYSNEYTDVFEDLSRAKYSEHKIIEYLLKVLKAAEDHVRRCDRSGKLSDVITDFIDRYCPRIVQGERLQGKTRTYAEQCVGILWLMSMKQPPLQLEFIDTSTEKKKFDADRYRAYTRSGKFVEFCVWPVLLLYPGGPILTKGIAQGC